MKLFPTLLQRAPQHSNQPSPIEQSSLQKVEMCKQYSNSTSAPLLKNMRQPSSIRLLPAIGVGVLAVASRQFINAIPWQHDNAQSPYSKNDLLVPNSNMEQDYLRVLCTSDGFDISPGWNTGHCMIGVTNLHRDGWLVSDTSADDDYLTSGSVDTVGFDWHEFAEGTYRTLPIDTDQMQILFDTIDEFEIAGDNAWGLIENCSYFAKTVWSKVTGEDIICSIPRLCTPQLLSQQLMILNEQSL